MGIYQILDDHNIEYERHDHSPVFTCEEADRLVPFLSAAKTKTSSFVTKRDGATFSLLLDPGKLLI